MYSVYAASAYIIHDRNFSSYCRPNLLYLPEATAFKLAVLKQCLLAPPTDTPPYTTVQRPASTTTQPEFIAPRPTYADVLRGPLKPRAAWMKEVPPVMSDTDADAIWHQGNDNLFGRQQTDDEIRAQIHKLQSLLDQRQQSDTQVFPLAPRVFRQGLRQNKADGNRTSGVSQSDLRKRKKSDLSQSNESSSSSSIFFDGEKRHTSPPKPSLNQSVSSSPPDKIVENSDCVQKETNNALLRPTKRK